MPEPVELRFIETGIDPLVEKMERLAKAMDALPSNGVVRFSAGPGGGGGVVQRLAGSGGSGAPAGVAQKLVPSVPGVAGTAQASATANVRVAVGAIAQAAQGGASSLSGLLGVVTKLPPPLALATAAIAGLVAAAVHGYQTIQSAITPGFQNGYGSYNASRGVWQALGTDNPVSKARSLSNALNGDPYARSEAYRAGINPNSGVYGGDLDDLSKAMKWIRRLGDPRRTSEDEARRASRASGDVFSDEISRLRAASPDVREAALNNMARQMDPAMVQKAADAQLKWNILLGKFSDLADSLGGPFIDFLNSWFDGNKSATSSFGPKVVDKNGHIVNAPDPKKDKEAAGRDRYAEALDRNTAALNKVGDGIYGGGARTRGGIPTGWDMNNWQQGVYRQAALNGI